MPECDGVTAAKKIRENLKLRQDGAEEIPTPKIIAFTGSYENRLHESMDDILMKPVRLEALTYLFLLPVLSVLFLDLSKNRSLQALH